VRLDIRRISGIKANDAAAPDIGSRVKVKIVKNKCAPPFQSAEFDILFNEGISHIGSLLDVGVECGIIEKKGTWFSYQSHRLGQGREAAREELKNNPKIADEIEKAIHAKISKKPVEALANA
jgi:recombination protein RecA